MRARKLRIVLLPLLASALACGGNGPTGPRYNMGPGGGTLSLAGGTVELTFPAGAVSDSVLVSTGFTVAPSAPTVVRGTVFSLTPSLTLAAPVQVAVAYRDASLPAGVLPRELRLYRAAGLAWDKVAGAVVDTTRRVVVASLTSLGTIGVLGSPAAAVVVTPGSAAVNVGETVRLSASVRDADGTLLPRRHVSWVSARPSLASVTDSGVVTGVRPGVDTVVATCESVSGRATLTVAQAPVAAVLVSPSAAIIGVGGTMQLSATVTDGQGTVLTGRTVTWSHSNPSVASLSGSGAVTGLAIGTDTVIATSEGVSGRAVVTVVDASTLHPHEPPGFTPLVDVDMSSMNFSPGRWAYCPLWDDTAYAHILSDTQQATIRPSPPSVLEYVFPVGFSDQTGPACAAHTWTAPVRRLYLSYWLKVSNPWQYHPTGVNKLFFLGTNGGANVDNEIIVALHGTSLANAEIEMGVQEPGNYGSGTASGFFTSNVSQPGFSLGVWHHVEMLFVQNTGGLANGQITVWVDGTMLGTHANVQYSTSTDGDFESVNLNPNWGGNSNAVKTERDYIRVDHFYASGVP
jgi:hypothetical protein